MFGLAHLAHPWVRGLPQNGRHGFTPCLFCGLLPGPICSSVLDGNMLYLFTFTVGVVIGM